MELAQSAPTDTRSIASRGDPMFQRTNSRLLSDHDLPNPNPKYAPFKNMAILTWLDNTGEIVTTYGCRRTFAQFPTKAGLFHYVGRVINGKTGKRKDKTNNKNAIASVQKQLDDLTAEVELWKKRARKAERALESFRKLLQS